jgi:hypothetical protein
VKPHIEFNSEYEQIEWVLDGHLHRNDGPAVLTKEGFQYWALNGTYVDIINLSMNRCEFKAICLTPEYGAEHIYHS